MTPDKLEPSCVFENFRAISKIPRGSGNEKAVSDFIADFARKHGAEVRQDEWHNLLIKKPASAGCEGREPIILQAHLDMVCEKNADTDFDFTRDALDLYVDGDFLRARGTTLGADNGIGVAMCMALVAGNYKHPPPENILPSDEEAGMSGAENFEIAALRGRRMINLDSSDDTTFTMGCAAGAVVELTVNEKRVNYPGMVPMMSCEVSVRGLQGGHSGVDIHRGRGNAIRIMAFLLEEIAARETVEISGGMKVNAIPREARAKFLLQAGHKKYYAEALEKSAAMFKEQYQKTDPGLEISWEFFDHPIKSIAKLTKALAALLLLPCGVLAQNLSLPGLVDASCNIGAIETREDAIIISVLARSANATFMQQIKMQLNALARTLAADMRVLQETPAWPYNPDSALLKTAQATYKSAVGEDAKVEAVHAGLECGLFSEKFAAAGEHLDIISIGPTAHDYHTPNERLSIGSTALVWKFLLALLADM